MPQAFLDTAATHRKTLQSALHLLTPIDKESLIKQEAELLRLRGELQSISHERVIMDVLTRTTISETKRIHQGAKELADKAKQQRYRIRLEASKSNTQNGKPNDNWSSNVLSKSNPSDPYALLNTPIHLPQYIPVKNRDGGSYQQQDSSDRLSGKCKHYGGVMARSVGSGIMVPNMRQGSLPEELQNIKTVPITSSSASAQISLEMRKGLKM